MTETVALLQSARAAGKGTTTTTTTPKNSTWAGAVPPRATGASAHHPSSTGATTGTGTTTAATTTARTVNGSAPVRPTAYASARSAGKTRLPVSSTNPPNCPSFTLHLHRQQAPSRPRSPASVIAAAKQRRRESSLASPPASSLPSTPAPAPAPAPAPVAEAAQVAAAVSPNPPGPNNDPTDSPSSSASSVGPDTQAQATTHRADRESALSSASSFDSPSCVRRRPRSFSDQGPRPTGIYNLGPQPPRRASNPEPLAGDSLFSSPSSRSSSSYARDHPRREPAFHSAKGLSTSTRPPPSLKGRLLHTASFDADSWARDQTQPSQGTRELLLLKSVSRNLPPNESKRSSAQITYKPPASDTLNSTPTRVPPIRSFRSSGSRRSLLLDMNYTPQPYELSDNGGTSLDDDDTLRSLDTRYQRHVREMTPPVSGRYGQPNADDTGDMFLNIARDEALNRANNSRAQDGAYSPAGQTGTFRPAHRRPMSTTVASYQPLSPPKLRRRLSDQQDRPEANNYDEDQDSHVSRFTNYRSLAREKAASAHPAEEASRLRSTATLRASPLSARSPVHQEASDPLRNSRRRSSVTDGSQQTPGRTPAYKSAAFQGHTKAYSSSPLVRSFDLRQQYGQDAQQNGMEGTESTTSTTAPSTVWDELDDLKSRIHRLELTGKLPSTSGAAVSRMSENRPATATTTVTTASLSPKRQNAGQADESSTATSTQKEMQPILQQALLKSKHILGPEIFQALESAANDAMGLSSMLGLPGQPGPMSGAASNVGSTNTVTDRQLRRKADSVCRSLTELCLALNEDGAANGSVHPAQSYAAESVRGTPTTPTIPKSYSGLPQSRRSSIVGEGNIPASHSSPRVMSKFEERRNSLLHGSGPPVSLLTNPNHAPANDSHSRRSSLLVSRTRQTASDEPQDGRDSSLLRSRRAKTEELEEAGRRASYLTRNRRGTGGEGVDQQPLSRSPTRVNQQYSSGPASETPEPQDAAQENASNVSSASRRRFVSDLHSSRLAAPSGSSPAPPRKYLERSVSTRDGGAPVENRVSRNFSMHGHSGSLSTRRANRESMIPASPSTPLPDYGSAQ